MLDHDHRTSMSKSASLRLFILLFTPVALLILGGAWYVGKERIEEEVALIRTSEIANVVMGVRRLDDELRAPLNQLRLLAGEDAVRRAVETEGARELRELESSFARLIAYTGHYDKVRWIDEQGRERARVNNVAGQAQVVGPEYLQRVADTHYFKAGMQLPAGQVHVSPLDLNVEHGKLETPRRPVLRLITPLHGADGAARGILVLNVAGQALLDAFTDSLEEIRDHAMLVNADGYWLKHPNSALEWGFLFNRQDTLGKHHPEAWQAIRAIPSGQEELADGLWTWSTVYPLKLQDAQAASAPPTWLVVSHLSQQHLEALRQAAWRSVGMYMIVLLLVYAAIAVWLTEAAQRVSQAKERFRLVVEANINGLLVVDREGRIVLVNPALAGMFGYAREELVGQTLDMLLPEAGRSFHAGYFAAYLRDPEARPMGMGRELYGRRKDGSLFPIEISLSPFHENGELFVDAFVADISERRRSELLHRRIEARLQLMMQTNPNGLLVVDDQGAIEMANPALERMFGYAPGELLNQSLERLLPVELRQRHVKLREGYMQQPAIRAMGGGMVLHGLRKDGTTIPVEVSLASFVEEGRTYAQATVIDASGRG